MRRWRREELTAYKTFQVHEALKLHQAALEVHKTMQVNKSMDLHEPKPKR